MAGPPGEPPVVFVEFGLASIVAWNGDGAAITTMTTAIPTATVNLRMQIPQEWNVKPPVFSPEWAIVLESMPWVNRQNRETFLPAQRFRAIACR